MARTLKDGKKKKVPVTIAVDPDLWEEIGKRVEELRSRLISKGIDRRQAEAFYNRSMLVNECLKTLGNPESVNLIWSKFALIFGVDESQTDLFKDGFGGAKTK